MFERYPKTACKYTTSFHFNKTQKEKKINCFYYLCALQKEIDYV